MPKGRSWLDQSESKFSDTLYTTKGNHGQLNETPHENRRMKNLQPGSAVLKTPEICRAWSSIVIDVLWADLDSIFPLLELIAPLERDSERRLVFPDLVERVDWGRFDSYARRVRSLAYNDTEDRLTQNGYTGIISKTIFSDIYINNPKSGPLLPNATKVVWMTYDPDTALLLLPFLSDSTLSLHVELGPKFPVKAINSLLNRLGGRVPDLLDFNFFIHKQVDDVDEGLAKCLGEMETL
ncbi:hypothetical protein FRB95_001248 [Tulasnella sp. JGI-2019a]|nr:hypothetical protein FRB95_001248 [Tulasnella sp. JGI-2019a]